MASRRWVFTLSFLIQIVLIGGVLDSPPARSAPEKAVRGQPGASTQELSLLRRSTPGSELIAGCGCCTDPTCDGAFSVVDFTSILNRAHRGTAGAFAPGCPMELTDLTCDGCTNIIDVIVGLGITFQGEPGPGCEAAIV